MFEEGETDTIPEKGNRKKKIASILSLYPFDSMYRAENYLRDYLRCAMENIDQSELTTERLKRFGVIWKGFMKRLVV